MPIRFEIESSESIEINTYTNGDTRITSSSYRDDAGLMVVFHDCLSACFKGMNEGHKFNGLLLNVYILGSSRRSSDSFVGERMAGCGNIARPWTSCCDISSKTKRILSMAAVVLMDDFKLSRHGERTDMVLQSLMSRYSEGNMQFAMSDVSMAYCFALYKLQQEDDMSRRSGLVRELITGLLLEIYSKEQRRIVSEPHEDHVIADDIFADMLSKPMVIDRNCLREIYENNGVNECKAIRLFKRRYGMAPYAYFKRTRLQMGAALLMTGETNIQKVASRVGYSSESKFAIAFRKQYGVRPKHFLSHIIDS